MLQESLIYRFAYIVFAYLAKSWNESFIARSTRSLGSFFRKLFSGSGVFSFIAREGSVDRGLETSIFFRLLDGILDLPQRLLHPLYKRAEQVFGASLLFKVLLFILKKLHLLVAFLLFIVFITEDQSWHNQYSTAAVVLLVLLYFLRTVVEGKTGLYLKAYNGFLMLFALCVLLAEVFSITPHESLRFLAFYLTCFLLVLLMIGTIRTREDMSEIIGIMLAGMTIAGLYGMYQKVVGVPVNVAWVDTTVNQGDLTRVYSFFSNPNNFAEIIVLLLPFYMAAFFNTKSILMKLLYLAMAVPPFLSLLFTQMRGAWIGFALAGLVYVFFKEKRLIPVFILLGILSIPVLPQSIILRLKTITNPADSSAETRLDIYRTVIPILKDYWFTGLGLGNQTLLKVSRNYYIFTEKGSIPSHCHDLYLQLWIETGVTGILSFLAFLVSTVKKSIREIWSRRDSYVNNILIAGLASLAGILAIGVIEYVWFYQRVMLFFWAVIGLMLAALCLRMRSEDKNEAQAAQTVQEDQEEQEVAG